MDTLNILEAQELTVAFHKLLAVNRLTFSVEEGEIYGIAGPNGAGKTTVFNAVTGFHRSSGSIRFQGQSIERLSPHQICRRGIGRTFQVPQLFTTLSVFENVKVGAHFGGTGRRGENEAVEEALTMVGLESKAHDNADGLNLFDKKMTMIAAALATKPRLLLLDEPIGGLSPKEARQSIDLFKRINRELNLTIVVIEHVMRVLTEIADRLMILADGKRVCLGPPEEVCRDEQVVAMYLGTGA